MAGTRAKACNRLHALLVEIEPGGIGSKMTANKAIELLNGVEMASAVIAHRVEIANELVAEISALDERLKASTKRVAAAVAASGTTLTDIVGVGPIGAAIILWRSRRHRQIRDEGTVRIIQRNCSDRGLLR